MKKTSEIKLIPVTPRTEGFWSEVFMDTAVQTNLFRPPVGDGDFQKWVYSAERFTLQRDDENVGIGTMVPHETRCFFGYALAEAFRGQHLSLPCLVAIADYAKSMGFRTLTTNVLKTNTPSIRTLERAGFRPFRWYEKNIF